MAVEWTDATITKTYLKGAGTSLSNAEIDEIIEECEAFFKVLLKIPSDYTYAGATEKVDKMLRLAVNLKAARIVIASTPQSFNSIGEAALALDLLEAEYTDAKKYLTNNRGYFEFINENPAA